jgi:hypothetical protein
MRGRLITDESSLQIRAPNIRMKGHGVSSRSSRGEIDTLNRRGEQDGVTDCSRKTKEALCCACPLKAGRTAAPGHIAGLSISKQSLMVVYILPPNLPMASKDLQSTSPFLTMSG